MSPSLPAAANGGAGLSTSEPRVGPMTDPLAIGQVMARSGLFPDITRVSQAVVKVLAGRELSIGPFAAMSDIHIIEGKPVIGSRILAALVRQSAVYDYEVVEWTNERCAIDFYRHGQSSSPRSPSTGRTPSGPSSTSPPARASPPTTRSSRAT